MTDEQAYERVAQVLATAAVELIDLGELEPASVALGIAEGLTSDGDLGKFLEDAKVVIKQEVADRGT